MGIVIELAKSPVVQCLESVKDEHPEGVNGCAVVTVTPDGEYHCTMASMSAEQALAASELLRQMALDEIAERHD